MVLALMLIGSSAFSLICRYWPHFALVLRSASRQQAHAIDAMHASTRVDIGPRHLAIPPTALAADGSASPAGEYLSIARAK